MRIDIDGSGRRLSAELKLSAEYVRECFELRQGIVHWRYRPVEHFQDEHAWKVFTTKFAGKPAGRKEHSGYIGINMRHHGERLQFQAHRVIWFLHHGAWPTNCIDHINRIRDDNRIENLREVTVAENNRNCAKRRVYPYVAPGNSGTFTAQVRVGDRGIHLGVFATEEEADAHRKMVNAELERVARGLVAPAWRAGGRPPKNPGRQTLMKGSE
jgi:hypothetical protein